MEPIHVVPDSPVVEERPSRPRPEDRGTRLPVPMWDRIKIIVLLVGIWLVLLWAAKSDNPLITWNDAIRQQLRDAAVWLVLAGLEALRQIHYLICEQSAGYNRFWGERVFGGVNRRMGRFNDWNRYRLARALKFLTALVLFSWILGRIRHESPLDALFALPSTVWKAMPMVIQVVFIMLIAVGQFAAIFWFLSRGGVDTYMPDDIKTRFTDVWGQDAVLDRVKENMVFLENPESIEEKGGHVPSGILLWGPPGTGKTLMAEAVAGETGKPFVFVDPGAFTNMFMGVGILKVKSLFRKLRKLAVRYGGVIVFFDEADALGSRGALGEGGFQGAMTPAPGPFDSAAVHSCNGLGYLSPHSLQAAVTGGQLPGNALAMSGGQARPGLVSRIFYGAGMGGGGGMGTLQALLTELSGLKKPRGFTNRVLRRVLGMRPKPPPKYRILVMMATNMPQALDEALLRPGRIDRIYRVGYPSKAGRIRTYQGYFDKIKHDLTPAQMDRLATITPYATGATIKDLVNEALIQAIRDGRDTVTWQDVIRAKLLKSLGPPEDVEYIERERHAVALHEACHAVVAYRVRHHLTIDVATIEKGSSYLGMVASIPLEEQFTSWRSEYESDIMVALASLAGERMFFDGDNSSGVSGDLQSATSLAVFMEGYWGMGSGVGSHAVAKPFGANSLGVAEGNLLETHLGGRVEHRLGELLERTRELLEQNRRELFAVAHALEAHKTLTGEDVVAIIEGRQGPLVDGRVYADPAFLEVFEDYHAHALRAHRSKAHVSVPLPRLAPLTIGAPALPGNGNGHSNGNGNGNGNGHGAHGSGAGNGAGEDHDPGSEPVMGGPAAWPGPVGAWPEPPPGAWPGE